MVESRKIGAREKAQAQENFEKRDKYVIEVEVSCTCAAYTFPHYHAPPQFMGRGFSGGRNAPGKRGK